VDGLTLDIRPGEIFGMLGPNGSGKTTTLRILLGLLFPTSGTSLVFGRSPRDVETKKRIGYLPEESYLYQYLTARETLDFYGRLFDLGRSERRERTRQLLDMVGLTGAADRPVGEFSKGMSRRIGLAQALLNDPELLILDEPTAGLDPLGCRHVKDLMLALAQRGKTIILSSHLLADVEDVCDRIGILYNGRLRAHGRVSELLQKTDSARITTPVLPPETMRRVLATIREAVGREPQVERPTIDLEQFFIEVVGEAHRAAGDSSAAPGSEGVAGFLTPDT
jgi:ABC-2 type transport system ATP-binding protein